MSHTLTLKNSSKTVLLSDDVYQFLLKDMHLKEINFFEQLRLHSNGYAFYQKNTSNRGEGVYTTETIYLHKYIAEHCLTKPTSSKKLYVMFINGNRLDCTNNNLQWAERSQITKKTTQGSGFKGVYKDGIKYRATIYEKGERYELGIFDSEVAASEAYRLKSLELFGTI